MITDAEIIKRVWSIDLRDPSTLIGLDRGIREDLVEARMILSQRNSRVVPEARQKLVTARDGYSRLAFGILQRMKDFTPLSTDDNLAIMKIGLTVEMYTAVALEIAELIGECDEIIRIVSRNN